MGEYVQINKGFIPVLVTIGIVIIGNVYWLGGLHRDIYATMKTVKSISKSQKEYLLTQQQVERMQFDIEEIKEEIKILRRRNDYSNLGSKLAEELQPEVGPWQKAL